MRLLGIDFGTSNTAAVVGTADRRIRPLLFDGSPLLPSAIYLHPDGRILSGQDAERSARVDPARFEPNPKRRIDEGTILLGDRELSVADAFAVVLQRAAGEAYRQLGAAPDRVTLTHPARWAQPRRSTLRAAARLAGLGEPELVAEPIAAASYFTVVLGTAVDVGGALAIYDLGAGTFDATVVRRTTTGFEVLSEAGLADVGGLDFDSAIIDHFGRLYAATHPQEWRRLQSPPDAAARRHRRMLWEDVRGVKEMLSRATHADMHLPALDVDAHLTRDEFEGLIAPYIDRTVAALGSAIAEARISPHNLAGIFLVGGSSRIPLVASTIHRELGVAPTTLEQPETVVAEGAVRVGVMVSAPAPTPHSAGYFLGGPASPGQPVGASSAPPSSGGALILPPASPLSPAYQPLDVSQHPQPGFGMVQYEVRPASLMRPAASIPSETVSWLTTPAGILSQLGVFALAAILALLIFLAINGAGT